MTNEEYIQQHREEDIRKLALKKVPEGVDARWCLQQIEGWQLARKKLPRWAATEGVWFPPHISMEQCSSEQTATYKQSIVERLLPSEAERTIFADFTGGFGIDFSYMAQGFQHATYVEQQPHLCDIARHNFPLLGLPHADIINETAECLLSTLASQPSVLNSQPSALNSQPSPTNSHLSTTTAKLSPITAKLSALFLDPARRDDAGRKVVALEDCTPNVVELQDRLLALARFVIVKLSPMLDITQACRQLKRVSEVHVVSVRGECKEVLLVMEGSSLHPQGERDSDVRYHCVNLESEDKPFVITKSAHPIVPKLAECNALSPSHTLYEPNASILKAGVQDALCEHYPVEKLHPTSNLFVSREFIEDFPGRKFIIEAVSDFSKQGIKDLLKGVTQANLTIRNFPSTVAELRKRLKLKEGGDTYLFATTAAMGKVLIKCKKKQTYTIS